MSRLRGKRRPRKLSTAALTVFGRNAYSADRAKITFDFSYSTLKMTNANRVRTGF